MARKIIDIGTLGNDGTGDSIRDSFRKVNDNFRELYSSLGLGDKLTFLGLSDTPNVETYQSLFEPGSNATPFVTISNDAEGLAFKTLVGGSAISLDYDSDPDSITINSTFLGIVQDPDPRLGADLKVRSGGINYKIIELETPSQPDEASNKEYVDTKISLAGVNAFDPETRIANAAFGRMTGPLILSRDPERDDDEVFGGKIAATKSYVDQLAPVSAVNLFVATSGKDERPGIDIAFQGRSLSLAYRTIEAAMARAEELFLDSPLDIGPYQKTLTYGGGEFIAPLARIIKSPADVGTGFSASVLLSADQITLNSPGTNYFPGDILEFTGGDLPEDGGRIQIQVLSTVRTPGPIATFKIISRGIYQGGLPGTTAVGSTLISSGGPAGTTIGGSLATFDVTYRVSGINIPPSGAGQDYTLVSVRITGGGGAGAFGRANVVNGQIASITITDPGSGFTSFPTVEVDLPRFLIFTNSQRTDFSGYGTNSAEISRTQDIRPGLFLKGKNSGALAQILSYTRELVNFDGLLPDPEVDEDYEWFDVDILFGTFEVGEPIIYGDSTNFLQITVHVESGVYEENFPIKIPQNVAMMGDEFRRVLIKPRKGTSSSPWALQRFRRDPLIDGIDTRTGVVKPGGEQATGFLYGYHYLEDPTQPVYPKVNNAGGYRSAAQLLKLNKVFIQEEVIAWIAYQIENEIAPFSADFVFTSDLCKRDIGLMIDAVAFDLIKGEYYRSVSAGLKYYQAPSNLGDPAIAIGTGPGGQYEETKASIEKVLELALLAIENEAASPVFNTAEVQIVDRAFISEVGSGTVVSALFGVILDIIAPDNLKVNPVNFPKENDRMDVFLCNDATIIRRVSGQGHGGFMMVLDPTGQILAKSPYAQECSSFSRSIDQTLFAGGQFVDGFAGNLQFKHDAFLTDPITEEPIPTRLSVSGLDRYPELPASVIIDDVVYRINYVRNFVYNPNGSTADLELDANTPWERTAGKINCSIVLDEENNLVFESTDHRLQTNATIEFNTEPGGTLPTGLEEGTQYFILPNATNNTFKVTDVYGSLEPIDLSNDGSGQLQYQRLYEILMPGNRSMLGNDFTQINDLGYGVVAVNGGLIESVSMFSYYCRISMYSLAGGQIRSIGGSSAHGDYALVAEGSDPLELPTPTSLFYDLSQYAKAYVNSPAGLSNIAGGLILYVYDYDYPPLPGSEVEIIHTIAGARTTSLYTASQVSTVAGLPNVRKIDIVPAPAGLISGLIATVNLDENVTIRQRGTIILTNDLENVAVRPSTGLVLTEQFAIKQENPDLEPVPYRVLEFDAYRDADAPFLLSVNTANNTLSFLLTVTSVVTGSICVTDKSHKLRIGDQFVPLTTSNGFTADTIYYVISVPEYNRFTLSTSPGGSLHTLINGTDLSINGKKSHKFRENFLIKFESEVLPLSSDEENPLSLAETYYVLPFSESIDATTEFQISRSKNGSLIEFDPTQPASEFEFVVFGLTQTRLREDYEFVRLSVYAPNEFRDEYIVDNIRTPIIIDTIENQDFSGDIRAVITTTTPHGLVLGDIVGIATRTAADRLPGGLTVGNYYVRQVESATEVVVDVTASGAGLELIGSDEGFKSGREDGDWLIGRVKGIIGDTEFAISGTSLSQIQRLVGGKFVFDGQEYTVTQYDGIVETGEIYSKIYLDKPLESNIVGLSSNYNAVVGVAAGSTGAEGNLTIRISLTRATGHDLLEIGTGSYASTNYPNEIYGPPVNEINDSNETEERSVGRVFYVTTDQFGNFKVGRNFTVDQGTGEVKISSNISLSNIAAFQFKKGVSVSEFSDDDRFGNAASNVVPTSLAVLRFIDRRLGLRTNGTVVPSNDIIPGGQGFLPLNGIVGMKGDLNFNNFKGTNLEDCTSALDAVNLRSLTFDNFQDTTITSAASAHLLTFTGANNDAVNAVVQGDVVLALSGNTLTSSISNNVIINSDVKTDAAVAQSKLAMNLAKTITQTSLPSASAIAVTAAVAGRRYRIVTVGNTNFLNMGAPNSSIGTIFQATAVGIGTGTVTEIDSLQAELGVASFDDFQFTSTNGWISLKSNGIELPKLEKIPPLTVLGNDSLNTTGNVEAVLFSTIAQSGGAVRKEQYGLAVGEPTTGYLRRKNSSQYSEDTDFETVDHDSSNTEFTLVYRGAAGAFSAGDIDVTKLSIDGQQVLNTTAISGGGIVRLYGYNGAGGIAVSDSSVNTALRINTYRNESHKFRNLDDSLDAPITCSKITVPAIAAGSDNDSGGTIQGYWNLIEDSRLVATYSGDLAEYYEGDQEYEVGTVLVFGGDKEVTVSTQQGDNRVAGVVSNTAAYAMYEACPGLKNLIALQGRVPCKVVGKIRKGDMLITSNIPGVAIAAGSDVKIGTIIGKAIENYDSDHIGTIQVSIGRT